MSSPVNLERDMFWLDSVQSGFNAVDNPRSGVVLDFVGPGFVADRVGYVQSTLTANTSSATNVAAVGIRMLPPPFRS